MDVAVLAATCLVFGAYGSLIFDHQIQVDNARCTGVELKDKTLLQRHGWSLAFYTSLVLVAAAALVAARLATDNHGNGDFFVALESIATLIAFCAAIIAARYAAAVYRVESKREERAIRIEEEAQASRVAAWPHTRSRPLFPEKSKFGPKVPEYGIFIRNASDLPVTSFAWAVYVAGLRPGDKAATVEYVGKGSTELVPPSPEPRFEVFGAMIANNLSSCLDGYDVGKGDVVTIRADIEFRDTVGRTWGRESDGALSNDRVVTDMP